MNEVIDNTLSLVKFDKRMQSVDVENVSGKDLPMVWLDPQLLEQVLLNLFLNALDAMNAKEGTCARILGVRRGLRDDQIEIRVSDTGIGMNPEVCKRAFESFFTTKEIGKGTGLGLFISYNLITEVDGSISLESELGVGTTVIIRIPIRPKKDLISVDEIKDDSLRSAEAEVRDLPDGDAEMVFGALRERILGVGDFKTPPSGIDGLAIVAKHHSRFQSEVVSLLGSLDPKVLGIWVLRGWNESITDGKARDQLLSVSEGWANQEDNAMLKKAAPAALAAFRKGAD